jgi:site-specific recombinase XerD
VQWAVKQVAKAAGIIKVHHLAALLCHLLEDGMDIMTLKDLGHQNVETTMEYLHIAQLESTYFLVHRYTIYCNAAGSRCTAEKWAPKIAGLYQCSG